MSLSYQDFIARKSQLDGDSGFEPTFYSPNLFDFQRALVEWAVRKGRAAVFADCGLGKTAIQLNCAQNVVERTNGRVLILTPLAVGAQTVREAEKFGVEARQSRDGKAGGSGIVVTNYEKLHLFDSADFAGVVCDESSAIKAFDGKRRKEVTRFLSKTPYRFMFTATPSPNDFVELGTTSEALGHLGQMDMLGMFFRSTTDMHHVFFKQGDFWNQQKWTFKAHSETPFWRWVCSWGRAIRRPSDLGFSDDGFILPELRVTQHLVKADTCFDGELFPRIAQTLAEQREERKATMKERCERVAELVAHDRPAVAWCQYNEEGDILERMIPGAVQVAGADSDEAKEERLTAFSTGQVRVLVSKPKICSWGLNWQHCGDMTFFPSHSFEQYYQAVRRCLRFGRVGPVDVSIVATEGEAGVTENLAKKAAKAEEMFAALFAEMHNALSVQRSANFGTKLEPPSWL